ncbi:hypothetical protein KEJ39_02045 [Candidatus Bathyarchaeota archaeon]|nr:hypothetical protein [Candidatus Bathyarchaeota archaeon]
MAEKIPSWLERLLLPRLSSLEGELRAFRGEVTGEFKAVHARIDSLEKETSSLRGEMNTRILSLERELVSLRNEINTRFDALESKVSLVEDVTRLKMEVKALADKVAAIAGS